MRTVKFKPGRPQILVVEDDPLLLEVMEAALEQEGYSFVTAQTGDEAVQKAYQLQPFVVLLDIDLPGQSGYLVAAKLKLAASAPKILFMTALPRGQSDRIAAFLRADGIIHKPFSVAKLAGLLDGLLGLTHAA